MKRLNRAQLKQREELSKRLNEAAAEVEEAIQLANSKIAFYNEAVTDTETFRDEIVGEMENYADDRSDKWRESDAGSNYESWKSDWEALNVEELEEIELPTTDLADELEALPEQVEG